MILSRFCSLKSVSAALSCVASSSMAFWSSFLASLSLTPAAPWRTTRDRARSCMIDSFSLISVSKRATSRVFASSSA
mgnify:CR=1 FL=1